MKLSNTKLTEIASDTGFRADTLEKVIRLLDLLNHIFASDYLRPRLVLKGGTALNLFIFNVPRLSVDIDLNYIGAMNLEKMQTERPNVEAELLGICRRCDFTVTDIPLDDHAGGKWRLSYQAAVGGTSNLELDLNFMHRVVFHDINLVDSKAVGPYQATHIPLLDTLELAAGKVSALLTRRASRDLFDTARLNKFVNTANKKFRLTHVLYGAMNPRADWRNIGADNIAGSLTEMKRQLIPVLRTRELPAKKDDEQFLSNLTDECRRFVAPLFPLTPKEREFITVLRERGRIESELLTTDRSLAEKIAQHPGLLRRAEAARRK